MTPSADRPVFARPLRAGAVAGAIAALGLSGVAMADISVGLGPQKLGLFSVFIAFVTGVAWYMIAPAHAGRCLGQFRAEPLRTAIIGVVLLIGVPIAATLVMITIIGIPLGVAAFVVYGFMVLLAYGVGAALLGDLVFNRSGAAISLERRIGHMGLALLVLWALSRLGPLGELLDFVVVVSGLGAMAVAVSSARGVKRRRSII